MESKADLAASLDYNQFKSSLLASSSITCVPGSDRGEKATSLPQLSVPLPGVWFKLNTYSVRAENDTLATMHITLSGFLICFGSY